MLAGAELAALTGPAGPGLGPGRAEGPARPPGPAADQVRTGSLVGSEDAGPRAGPGFEARAWPRRGGRVRTLGLSLSGDEGIAVSVSRAVGGLQASVSLSVKLGHPRASLMGLIQEMTDESFRHTVGSQ